MHTAIRLLATLTLALAVPGSTYAVSTYTPPIRSSEGNNFDCTAQNVGSSAVTVAAEIDNGVGTVVSSASLSIAAGKAFQIVSSAASIPGGFCKFTFDGDPAAVRGVVSREDAGGSDTRLIEPARVLTDGGPAVDTFLATVPIRSSQGNNFGCQVLNLSGAAVQVISELQNGNGVVVDSETLTVPSGQSRQLAFTQSAVFAGYCTCHFLAPPDQVRCFATLEKKGGGDTQLIVEATLAESTEPPATPTPTATATVPPTATATMPPDATPTATTVATVPACCGDCDGDGTVAINELITAVNNALSGCPATP
jgi:hypothetical protein